MISPKVPNSSSDSWSKAVLNIDLNLPRKIPFLRSFHAMGHCGELCYAVWATAADLVIRYGPLPRIWLYAMGHCGRFGCALRPLHRMKLYSKISIDFCAMGHSVWFGNALWGHSAGFGYPLWAIAKDMLKRYWPWHSIWLCTMGHNAKPITIAQN
jgi:hypothetical protein